MNDQNATDREDFVVLDADGNEYDRQGSYTSHRDLGRGVYEVLSNDGRSKHKLTVPDGGHFEIVPR